MTIQAEKRVSTDTLMKSLFRTKKLGNFMKHYGNRLEDGNISEYLTQYCREHGRSISKAIRDAQIDRSYGYQISGASGFHQETNCSSWRLACV